MTTRGDPREQHHVFLIPGLFGFTQLAGYDYFGHVERAIGARFAGAGVPCRIHLVPSLPTSSITARAAETARTVTRAAGASGPIHLLGHSSGGLDARLCVSPSRRVRFSTDEIDWASRVRTLVSVNTPHYGTPLAAYFSTVSGTRLLSALSLLTVTTLSLGHAPLAALAGAVSAIRAIDGRLGLDIRFVDDMTENLLRFVGEQGRKEIRTFLTRMKEDQAGIVQLMPEVCELFNTTTRDEPRIRYGCVMTCAPPPGPRRLVPAVLSPLRALQLVVYTTLFGVASSVDQRYHYAAPSLEESRALHLGLHREATPDLVDGIVPTLSMLWGELLWCGPADHLDVVGHFEDDFRHGEHVDWLHSGAHFRRKDFDAMADAVVGFMLRDSPS
ncbi:MAG TPA: hypothetical protein VHE30_12045 [Polyangiaceae bacterium]|nr:hypothetical protein [Polyangiaceae bacterium]